MIEVALFVAGFGLATAVHWREACRLRASIEKAEARVEHAHGLLIRREAPAEEQWWQADSSPVTSEIPEDATWDESGLFWTLPAESE